MRIEELDQNYQSHAEEEDDFNKENMSPNCKIDREIEHYENGHSIEKELSVIKCREYANSPFMRDSDEEGQVVIKATSEF